MNEAKKQLELLLINYFRDCYPDFPKGKISAGESPDFVVKQKNRKKLGIELTRLHSSDSTALINQPAEAGLFVELIETSRELFERTSDWKLFVKFGFSESNVITQQRLLSVAARIAGGIRKTLVNKNPCSFFYETIQKTQLPAGIMEILVVHHPVLKTSVWEQVNNLGISGNIVDDIRHVIQKKEEKLPLYRKQSPNENWLLISSDQLQSAKNYNINNQLLKQQFPSGFARVLLFQLMKGKIIELG